MLTRSIVAAAKNDSHTFRSVRNAIQHILENLSPPLCSVVKKGHRVLVKVNMGCSGARQPEARLTTHPLMVEAIITALQDCGAVVSFGDDVARAGKYCDAIYRATGMFDVAKRTGAMLVDFVTPGAREVRGRLAFPRSYLITNAYFDSDVVINAASCRSHVGIGLSGAIKNMFGCVVGLRKQLIHNLFPGNPRLFGRVIADIYRAIEADFSFLDLTSVAEAAGITLAVRPVGLILGSTDAVALDTVACQAIGYRELPIWASHYAGKFGIGCNVMDGIEIRGIDWPTFGRRSLKYPFVAPAMSIAAYDRATAILNQTVLRPRPVVKASECTGCGDCVRRCPVHCITPTRDSVYRIDLAHCADCGCCVKTCESGAINIEYVGLGKIVRQLMNRLPEIVEPKAPNALDPSPMK